MNVETMETKKYIKKELIILTVSIIILTVVILFCYIMLYMKYGSSTWVSIEDYFLIGDMEFLISQIFFLGLTIIFILTNYKIFEKKKKTALWLTILFPIWLILLFTNIRAVMASMVQEMDIPGGYLWTSFWYLLALTLYLIPVYYLRFRYYSDLVKNHIQVTNIDEGGLT